MCTNLLLLHWKKNGVETTFTQKLQVNFTYIYKKASNTSLNVDFEIERLK